VLIEQIDIVGLKASQAALDGRLDVLRLAVDAAVVHAGDRVDIPAEFGGNLNLRAERPERFADHLLIDEGAVRFRRVEEVDAALDRLTDKRDHLGPIPKQARFAVAHASEGEGRHFKSAASELSFLHRGLPRSGPSRDSHLGANTVRTRCHRQHAPMTLAHQFSESPKRPTYQPRSAPPRRFTATCLGMLRDDLDLDA
jgi:hypothetical protein